MENNEYFDYIEDYRKYISKFNDEDLYSSKDKKEIDNIIEDFQKKYSVDKLKSMSMKEFVIGSNGHGFYHVMKVQTKPVGGINVFPNKYWVYKKGDGTIDYVKGIRVGGVPFSTKEEAFEGFVNEIILLEKAAKDNDKKSLLENRLPKSLKYKLASMYYPDNFFFIYKDEVLDRLFKDLTGETFPDDYNYYDKTDFFIELRDSYEQTKGFSNHKFARLLYYLFGETEKKEGQIGAVELDNGALLLSNLRQYKDTKIRLEIVSLDELERQTKVEITTKNNGKTKSNNGAGKTNHAELNEIRKLNGSQAEILVVRKEKEFLMEKGLKDKADLVKRESVGNDSLGYDVLSFDENGNKKYIEVKSNKNRTTGFQMSSTEFNNAKQLKNYWLYLVWLDEKETKVFAINDIFSQENMEKLRFTPTSFQVDMKFLDK